jgi:hypothetical protein
VVRVGLGCALLSTPTFGAEVETPEVQLSERAELDRAIELYHSGQYETCKVDLERLLGHSDGEAQRLEDGGARERAHLYLATCTLMLGDEARSRQELREALEANPLMASPDSLSFPPPLVALFLQVRDEVQGLIARRETEEVERLRAAGQKAQAEQRARSARERALRELADQETLVTANTRVVAFLPFGAGQYQNGNRALGDFFLVTEAGVGLMAGVSGLILLDLYRQTLQVDPAANDNSKFQAAYTVFAVSSWTFVGLVALGALEANLSYKSMRVLGVRKRGLNLTDPSATSEPRGPKWTGLQLKTVEVYPFGGALPSGGFLGLTGRF